MRNIAVSRKREPLGKVCGKAANVHRIFHFYELFVLFVLSYTPAYCRFHEKFGSHPTNSDHAKRATRIGVTKFGERRFVRSEATE